MAAIVSAHVDYVSGWVQLRFPFDKQTVQRIKVPGARWDPKHDAWMLPLNAWDIVKGRLKIGSITVTERRAILPLEFQQKLRPYQLDGADFLIRRGSALLSMEQRTGKSAVALGAYEALRLAGLADAAFVIYPAGVKENWRAQIKQWTGRTLISFETSDPMNAADVEYLRSHPEYIIGCHWEVLHYHVFARDATDPDKVIKGTINPAIEALFADRRFVWIGDEIHAAKNRKGNRYNALRLLSTLPSCVARWGLTGTPQRNYPRDLWGIFDAIQPGSMGSYWAYTGIKDGIATGAGYCDGKLDERGHWFDKGESNTEELRARLAAFSYRVTRAQVAPHLPKAQRSVILCDLPHEQAKQYAQLEKAMAVRLKSALSDADPSGAERDALRAMALVTSQGKIPTAIDRMLSHADGRQVKCVVFAHHHEVLKNLEDALKVYYEAASDAQDVDHLPECIIADSVDRVCRCQSFPPWFLAGGWLSPKERHGIVEQWRTHPGPSILLANTLSLSVGIDLSDADCAIFLEQEWVPSDFFQVHDRLVDIHLGKRTTPPLYEYLVSKNTIDVDMAMALLSKIRSITNVVGADTGSKELTGALRESGLVQTSQLQLENTDKATVKSAIDALRAKLLGKAAPVDDKAKLAAAFGDEWDEEMIEEVE